MLNSVFKFKRFEVIQESNGLKIGTDAIVLGALSEINSNTKLILDVGTGTGVIALMLAQKNNVDAKIIAVEINEKSAQEATQNFNNSAWSSNLNCLNISFQEFSKLHFTNIDLIVSNPPYFNNSLKSKSSAKSIAKHTQELNFSELIEHSSKLLSPEGELHVIIPANEFNFFCSVAKSNGLFLKKIYWIKPTENSIPKRVVLFYSFVKNEKSEDTIVIKDATKEKYTEQFKMLTKDYYLNL
jgi:tRNA1Val (adenine37-N6)-methyltransferase